jgi:hypothetical protein
VEDSLVLQVIESRKPPVHGWQELLDRELDCIPGPIGALTLLELQKKPLPDEILRSSTVREYNAAVWAASRESLTLFARYSRSVQRHVRKEYQAAEKHGPFRPWEVAATLMQWLPATVAGVEGCYMLASFGLSGRTFAADEQDDSSPIYEIVLP